MSQFLRHAVLGASIGSPIALAVYLIGVAPEAGAKPLPKGNVTKGTVAKPAGQPGIVTGLPRASKVKRPRRAYESYECPATMHVRVDSAQAKKTGDFTSSYQAVMSANVDFSEVYVFEDGDDYLMQCVYVSSQAGATYLGVQDRRLTGKDECFEIADKAGCYE